MVSVEFFVDIILPCRPVALGLTQSVTEMGKGDRRVGLTLPPSFADCHEIWEPQPPGTLRACNGIALPFFILHAVVFTPVAREPANNEGCGQFPKTLDTHGCSVRLQSVD